MTITEPTDYYAVRERQERERADSADNPAVAAVHRTLADRYADLIVSAGAPPRQA